MTSKVTNWLTSVSTNARRAGAYFAMKLALWLDTNLTVSLCIALARENMRRQMELYGIDSFNPDYDADGNEVIRVTRREPTIH